MDGDYGGFKAGFFDNPVGRHRSATENVPELAGNQAVFRLLFSADRNRRALQYIEIVGRENETTRFRQRGQVNTF